MKSPEPSLEAAGLSSAPARVLALQLNLPAAWERVSTKRGMPGADGLTVQRFERSAPVFLRALEARLAADRYSPLPLRLAELEKKKRNTPSGEPVAAALRLLLVPCVSDRIAQTAVAQWLAARWNPLFDPDSFAYRAGLGVHDALRRLATLRDNGFRWLLDADIRVVLRFHRPYAPLSQARSFPDCGFPDAGLDPVLGRRSSVGWRNRYASHSWRSTRLPLSPSLPISIFTASIANCVPAASRSSDMRMTFLAFGRTPFEIASAREIVERALASLGLGLNVSKTRTTSFDTGLRFLGAEIRGEQILLPFEKMKTPKNNGIRSARNGARAVACLESRPALALNSLWFGPEGGGPPRIRPLPRIAHSSRPSRLLRLLAGPAAAFAESLTGQGIKL